MLQELQINGLWAGKQTGKGAPNAAPGRRFRQVAGALGVTREDGSENYSDATQFTDTQDWVNTLIGSGTPGVHATPDELAWLMWVLEGGETTIAVPPPPAVLVKTKHVVSPLPGLGHWTTWATRKGSSVVDRLQHNDCQLGQMQIEGSTANKAVRATPTIMSLDPGVQRAADPAAVMPAQAALLYTDGTGRFKIDGTVFRGHSQFTLVINKDLQPIYSDDVVVQDFALGTGVVTIAVTLYFDQDGRAQWNKLVYGNSAPAAGAKPLRTVSPLGAYEFDLQQRDAAGAVNNNKFKLAVPGVKWAIPAAPDPNPDGGAGELALAGAMRKVAGQPNYTVEIDTDAPAFAV
ncbi:MAG: phage tail tube protein [Solirubrobacteraceae bacterium]